MKRLIMAGWVVLAVVTGCQSAPIGGPGVQYDPVTKRILPTNVTFSTAMEGELTGADSFLGTNWLGTRALPYFIALPRGYLAHVTCAPGERVTQSRSGLADLVITNSADIWTSISDTLVHIEGATGHPALSKIQKINLDSMMAWVTAQLTNYQPVLPGPGIVTLGAPDPDQGIPYTMPVSRGHMILQKSADAGATWSDLATEVGSGATGWDATGNASTAYQYRAGTLWGAWGTVNGATTAALPEQAAAPVVNIPGAEAYPAQVVVPPCPANCTHFVRIEVNVDNGGWQEGNASGWFSGIGTDPGSGCNVLCPSGESHSYKVRFIGVNLYGETPGTETDFELSN